MSVFVIILFFFLYTLDFFVQSIQPLVGCDFFGLGYFFIPIEVESSIFLDFGNTSAPSFDWFECSIVFRRSSPRTSSHLLAREHFVCEY